MADPKDTTDQELTAVKAVIDAVKSLDSAARMRVMRAAEALTPPPQFTPPQPPPGTQGHPQGQPQSTPPR